MLGIHSTGVGGLEADWRNRGCTLLIHIHFFGVHWTFIGMCEHAVIKCTTSSLPKVNNGLCLAFKKKNYIVRLWAVNFAGVPPN